MTSSEVPRRADVVVIGGGPAGSMASGLLGKKGLDVVLLEKQAHPRDTVGESLLPHFWRYTDMLGDASRRIAAASFVTKAGGIVSWDGALRRTRFADFGHTRPALHVDRDLFDHLLLGASADLGTSVFERTRVVRVEAQGPLEIDVHYVSDDHGPGTIRARQVVDASGQSATVARQYGFREFDDDLKFSAFWGRFDGGSYLDYDAVQHPFERRFDSPPVTFVDSLGDWGWLWHIVLREHVSVGIILSPTALKVFKGREGTLEQKFEREVRETAHASRLLADAPLRSGSVRGIRNYAYKPVRLAVDGCYLVGDAAAFVDPINSAGVTFAMYAGALAAHCIERSLNDPSGAERYQELYAHQYRQRLEVFRLIALPPDCAGAADDARLVEALSFFSQTERELALTTTVLTQRSDRIAGLLRSAGTEVAAVYDELPLPLGFEAAG